MKKQWLKSTVIPTVLLGAMALSSMAQQSIVTAPGVPGTQFGVVSDQAATRATLSGIAATPFSSAVGYSQLQQLLTSAQGAQGVAQVNLTLAQTTAAAALATFNDAQNAFNADPNPATLVALNTATTALNTANDHVTDVNNQVNSYQQIINDVANVTGLNSSVSAAQTTAVAPLATAITAYTGGLVTTTPPPAATPTGGNLEGIMATVSAIPANPNQGYQAGDVLAASGVLGNPSFSVNAQDYIVGGGPGAGLLNGNYGGALLPVVGAVTTEYNNYITGLSTATQDQVLANMGNQSWERAAIASITDGTGSINVNNSTATTVNAGTVNVGTAGPIHSDANNALHLGTDSIVLTENGVPLGVNYNTISTSAGNLYLQNGNVSVSQAGDITGASVSANIIQTTGGGVIINGNTVIAQGNVVAAGIVQGSTVQDGAGAYMTGGNVYANTGNFGTVTTTGNVGVGGDLQVAGHSTLNGGLTVNGTTALNGDTTITAGGNSLAVTAANGTTVGGNLTVNGATTLNGNLDMAGHNIYNANEVNANTVNAGHLDVSGTTDMHGTLDMHNNTINNVNQVNATTLNATVGNITTVNSTTVTATGTITGSTLTTGAGASMNGNTVTAANGNFTTVDATTGNITTVNATTGNITTVNATTGNITTVNATTGNITTVNANEIYVGAANARIHTVGNDLHLGQNSIVLSDSLGGVDYNTISSSVGDLRLQNGNLNIAQGGDVTGASVQTAAAVTPGTRLVDYTVGQTSDARLATAAYAHQAASQALTEANAYTDNRYRKLRRGIAMTAALQTPTIDPGKENAVKVSVAGFEGEAGLSAGYARRVGEGWTVDVSAASSQDFKEAVVRGGVNFSF